MNSRFTRSIAVFAFLFLLSSFSLAYAGNAGQEDRAKALKTFLSLQIPFVENTGQLSGNVKYYARTLNGGFFVGEDGRITYSMSQCKDAEGLQVSTIQESFPGVTALLGQGEQKSAVQVSEFLGNTASNTTSTFDWLNAGQIASGVSLQLKAYGGSLQKIFIVQPGGKALNIAVRVEGSRGLSVNEQGELEIATTLGAIKSSKPLAYQEVNGVISYVDVSYDAGSTSYGFKVGKYDKTKDLFIVPSTFSTFADTTDPSLSIYNDGNGNTYIAGSTTSPSETDAFVAKLDASSRLESLGILGGAGMTEATAVTTDDQGNVYIAGGTTSSDFPITSGSYDATFHGQTDAFVAKFGSDLADLLASSFLSGSGADEAYALAIDQTGSVYVAGGTTSPDFPTTAGSYNSTPSGGEDAFLSKFDPDLRNLLASSLIGGSDQERATSITINPNGTVSVNGFVSLKTPATPSVVGPGSLSSTPIPFAATLDPSLGPLLSRSDSEYSKSGSTTATEVKTEESALSNDAETGKEKDEESGKKTSSVAGLGWSSGKPAPITPREAETYYRAKRRENAVKAAQTPPLQMGTMMATTQTSEITELARALRNDPKLIYDYVHNNIDYVPYFGSLKGATLTYLDASGNDFDQASLMIALLRAAGFSAQYVYGKMTIPGSQMANWVGVDQTAETIGAVIASGGGIIDTLWGDGQTKLYRVWVRATINGSEYVFDPAFKTYDYVTKINIEPSMGYSRANLLSAGGGTIGDSGFSIQSVNETALRSQLSTYTSNLVNTIKNDYPNADVNQIIGGRSIVQTCLTEYQTALPFSTELGETWTDIPDEYAATLRIVHQGVDYTFKMHDLSGKRLTVTYTNDSYHRPRLLLDGGTPTCGTGTSTGNPTTLGSTYNLLIYIDHPYAAAGPSGESGSYCDEPQPNRQPVPMVIRSGSTYAIVYNFGGASSLLLQKRQNQLEVYRAQGLTDTSEEIRGETLNIMGQTWVKEVAMSDFLLSALSETVHIRHHKVGLMSQEEVGSEGQYYIDLPFGMDSDISKRDVALDEQARFKVGSLIRSSFEHGIIAQLMNSTAASTMSLFQIANSTGRKVFSVTSLSNLESIVWPQLSGYTSNPNNPDDLTTDRGVFRQYLNNGYTLILPDKGNLTSAGWDWSGKGYITKYFSTNSWWMGMIIGGGYSGGFNSVIGDVSPDAVSDNVYLAIINTSTPETKGQQVSLNPPDRSKDPVDMASGAYLYDRADLSLGSGAPLGLALSRAYNSNTNLTRRSLGYGWTHNYDIYLTPTSHGEPGLGYSQPVDAAAMIVGLYACFDIMKNASDTIQPWMAASLIAKWTVDQVINNAVVVTLGSKVMEYIKLPDGTYASPPGITTNLVKNADNTYTLQERMGTRINFNSSNKVSQIIDVDGNTMTFTYNGSNLSTVRDAFNRTLTFSSASGRINSVTDSSSPSRSVSYGYDSNNNLTSYTDPEQKVWSYVYSDPTNHRMTSLRNPYNTTTATNAYDSLGRVMTQTVPRQTGTAVYNFYFSGFMNQEEDPSGNRIIYYYDQKGREYAKKDALGNTVRKVFDGQDHTVSVTDPRMYTTSLLYEDGKNNLTRITDPLTHQINNTYETTAPYRLTDTTDPLDHVTHFTYDTENHLLSTSVYPALGQTITNSATYYANGFKNTAIDGRGTVATFTYDSYGNPQTSRIGSHNPVTYVYDTIGRMTGLTDQLDSATSFTYDKRSLPRIKTDPLNKQSTLVYDNAGRLQTRTDRKNQTTTYTYTPTDKIDTITYPGGSTVHYTYNQLDQLTSMVDFMGATSYGYDAAGRLTSSTNPHGFAVSYHYDAAGNLDQLTYPGNKTVYYTYDELNRLHMATIGWITPNPVATYAYDAAGRLDYVTNFNGTVTDYGYDNANRLTSLENRKSDSTILATYAFTLDGNGNRTNTTQTEQYTNLPSYSSTSYTYNLQKNRLLTAGGNNFTYDDEGQLGTGYGSTYTFDYEHRLTDVGSTTFSYDGAGNRLQAVRSGVTTRYLYDASGNLLAEADGSNNITKYYIHGAGLLATVTPANAVCCYHFNATGHTMAVTDSAQAVANKYSYDAYGTVTNQQEAVTQPFKYVGQLGVMTEPNGFYYMRARYYDPQVGRFISEDPIGFDGGDENLYAYVGGNPVMGVDPSGLDVLIAIRKANGTVLETFNANHVYLWSTVYNRGEGTAGSSGSHSAGPEVQPANGNYIRITGLSPEKELTVINYMRDTKNSGVYVPYINDCFSHAQATIDHFNLGITIPWSRTGNIKPVADSVINTVNTTFSTINGK